MTKIGEKAASMEEKELDVLRRQNAELKGLVQKALQKRLQLEDLPLELRDDRQFVLAAAGARRRYKLTAELNWSALPQKWKDDVEVACATFGRQKRSVVRNGRGRNIFSASVVESTQNTLRWSELPYHLKINEDLLQCALRTAYGPTWKDIPIWFQDNVDLLSTAVQYEKIPFGDVPPKLQKNHREIAFCGVQRGFLSADECLCLDDVFFKQVIEEGELDWEKLPTKLKHNVNFALSISHFAFKELPDQMMSHVVKLHRDQVFWRRLLHLPELDNDFTRFEFRRLLEKFAPTELRSDCDFMLEMIQQYAGAYELVDDVLVDDPAFLELALEANAAVLKCLSQETQELHRDLVLKAIPRLLQSPDKKDMVDYYVAENMRSSFWEDFDFAMTWVEAGLGFPTSEVLGDLFTEWRLDRDLSLANAKHGGGLYYAGQFKGDIDFMREVVEHQPELYYQATGAAKIDPVVMTTAFASLPKLASSVMTNLHFQGLDDEIQDYLHFLRSNLIAFETFSKCILGNMLSTQTVEVTGTNLTLLNQGLETSSEYKKVLAEYLGIPTGKWLCRLQQAERNVLEAVAPWAQNAV